MARILFIDDNEDIRLLGRETLGRAGHEVIEALNGTEGTRLYREHPFDLVITDLIMPEKEGLETIQELRQEFGDVKIIAISGGSARMPGDFLRIAKKMGATEVLDKPFQIDTLLELTERLLKE